MHGVRGHYTWFTRRADMLAEWHLPVNTRVTMLKARVEILERLHVVGEVNYH